MTVHLAVPLCLCLESQKRSHDRLPLNNGSRPIAPDHIKRIMTIKQYDSQLHMSTLFDLLRGYQKTTTLPSFPQF
jgi:hypothetical protein